MSSGGRSWRSDIAITLQLSEPPGEGKPCQRGWKDGSPHASLLMDRVRISEMAQVPYRRRGEGDDRIKIQYKERSYDGISPEVVEKKKRPLQ